MKVESGLLADKSNTICSALPRRHLAPLKSPQIPQFRGKSQMPIIQNIAFVPQNLGSVRETVLVYMKDMSLGQG